MHPPRFTPRLLPPKPRDLVRDTPPRSGDTSQCRVSARARGFLRGSPQGCCYPNNGTSCVRLHPTVVMPCVCPCTGLPPRFTPRLLRPKPREVYAVDLQHMFYCTLFGNFGLQTSIEVLCNIFLVYFFHYSNLERRKEEFPSE